MKSKKIFKFKKGDIVYCSAFVFTIYEPNLPPQITRFPDMQILHTPEGRGIKKLLVRTELAKDWKYPFLIVAIKQIQTGTYFRGRAPSPNWIGYDEGSQPEFYPNKYHDVYVLESMRSPRWGKLDYALEEDLRIEK